MRRVIIVLLLCGTVVAYGLDADIRPDRCRTVQACIARLHKVAEPPRDFAQYISQEEQAVINRLLQFGEQAVPPLIELLADPNEDVAQIAAAALRDVDHIDSRFLPRIIAGLDRGLPWLPPALGRIDSPEAAREAVERFLVSESDPYSQEAYAVELSGSRAIPFIVDAARCRRSCRRSDYLNLGHVLGEMGEAKAAAAPGLLSITTDDASPKIAVVGALHMIASLGEHGQSIEGELLGLRDRRPDLGYEVDSALVGIRSAAAGEVFSRRLKEEPNILTLRDLAETGVAAVDACPVATDLIDHPDWDIRVATARALGFIECQAAAAKLMQLLDVDFDVQLNWVAAESLGRTRAAVAQDALTRIAGTHWYPPVRQAATTALEHIEAGTTYVRRYSYNFPFEFFAYEHIGEGVRTCPTIPLPLKTEPESKKLSLPNAKEELESLSYQTELLSYGTNEKPATDENGEPEVIEVTPENIAEFRETIHQVPNVALRVDDGWLVGSDRGEWGGELAFIGDDGTLTVIVNENVKNIHLVGDRWIVVAGLSHLLSSRGMLFDVFRTPAGAWSYSPWRRLPSAPKSSRLVETGELLIEDYYGASILVSEAGSMRMAPCEDK
jgi:HEAT repeat protein